MEATLKYILFGIALVAIGSGVNVLIGGAAAIPGASGGAEATIDNELRFFSAFWVAYGAFTFWVGLNIEKQQQFIPLIALVFFIGGLGRLLSWVLIGSPSTVLVSAMILEFILPIVIYILYRKINFSQ